MSAHLFIICAEVFSRLIEVAEEEGRLKGIAVARGVPRVSHLLFVDDSLIFPHATMEVTECIKEVLGTYKRMLGQQINLHKLDILLSAGIPLETRFPVVALLEVQEVEKFDKYLDLPIVVGRSKKDVFQIIRDRVWQKVLRWKEKLLLQAGKHTLIMEVLQAIISYAMSSFHLPESLIKEFESVFAEFLWSSPTRGRSTGWRGVECVRAKGMIGSISRTCGVSI
ncbi:UNVERIFIED_CONTAM: hypothetical protein Sradi_4539100 [Sesamum radiatum]|uniref:Reverse transcriptase domain-containing protein n=1 Tax=Sesamum radiatum TaxID=300843 RepID=A0AAW2NB26_SESRA